MSKEIKTWLDTSLVTIQNNLEELANTIKTIKGPYYNIEEIKQNINNLLTFMNKIMNYIRVTIVYDHNNNLSTFPFDNENGLIVLAKDELDKIKITNNYFHVNEEYINLDNIFVSIDSVKELFGILEVWRSNFHPRTYIDIVNAIIKLSPSNLNNLLTILSSNEKISKLNELLK